MIISVNAKASAEGNGSAENPFKTIQQAALIALAGDEVLVAPGIYHEYVNPINGGSKSKRISYKSTEPLGAVITGAEPIYLTYIKQYFFHSFSSFQLNFLSGTNVVSSKSYFQSCSWKSIWIKKEIGITEMILSLEEKVK